MATPFPALTRHAYANQAMNMPHNLGRPLVTQMPSSNVREQRVRFALFIKILFKRLEQSGEVPLHDKAKRLLVAITRRNKAGDPECSPLIDALEVRLRALVGEAHWRRAHGYMQYYLIRNEHAQSSKKRAFHNLAHAA